MATPRSPLRENRLPITDKCIKRNQLDLQPSLIIFVIYVQRLANMNTNCDVLGQSTVPILGQLFGYMDELVTRYGILIFLCFAPCTLLGLRLCFSLYGLSVCWAGHNHLRQTNR